MSVVDRVIADPIQPAARAYRESADHRYIPCLDGIRALAVLIVIFSHYGLGALMPGAFGVTLFFFVSGFIITRLLIAEHARYGAVFVRNFYLRRFWRLVPALLAMVAAMTVFYSVTRPALAWPELYAAFFYYMNYYAIFHDTTMAFYPLWSLAVEEHYYLLFAFAFAAVWPMKRRLALAVSTVLAAVLLWRIYLALLAGGVPANYTQIATDTRVDSILFGALFAIGLEFSAIRERLRRFDRGVVMLAAAAGLLLTFTIRNEVFRETVRYTLQGLALVPLFYGAMFGTSLAAARRLLETAPLRYIGRLSYSLYLWNLPCLVLVGAALPDASPLPRYAASGVATFLAAAASYYLVEQGCRRLRQRYRPGHAPATRPLTPQLAAG